MVASDWSKLAPKHQFGEASGSIDGPGGRSGYGFSRVESIIGLHSDCTSKKKSLLRSDKLTDEKKKKLNPALRRSLKTASIFGWVYLKNSQTIIVWNSSL